LPKGPRPSGWTDPRDGAVNTAAKIGTKDMVADRVRAVQDSGIEPMADTIMGTLVRRLPPRHALGN